MAKMIGSGVLPIHTYITNLKDLCKLFFKLLSMTENLMGGRGHDHAKTQVSPTFIDSSII